MEEKIAVSVIIPFYNVAKYFDECLSSLKRQTFQNFEVILIDDGSTDGSGDIAQKYVDCFLKCTMITKENEGQGKARNIGLQLACGKYVYFLDSDDYIADDALEILYHQAEKQKADLVLFSGKAFRDQPANRYFSERESYIRKGKYSKERYEGQELFALLKRNRDYTCSVCLQFVRRDLLQGENITFPVNTAYEDEYYAFLLFMKSRNVYVMADELFFRRIRMDSTMTSKRNARHFMGYAALCDQMTEWYQSGPLNPRWKWAVKMHAADFFKGAVCRVYFKMDMEERNKVEWERKELLRKGRRNVCYGNGRIFFVCYFWRLYSRYRDARADHE